MFKLVKALGRFVSKMYNVEARKQKSIAQAKAQKAIEMSLQSVVLEKEAGEHADQAARIALQAQTIGRFFE